MGHNYTFVNDSRIRYELTKHIILQELQRFPTSCPSVVYIADMHGIYNSKYPYEIQCEIEHKAVNQISLRFQLS